jgi:uncharacterized protein (DUF58 family)
VARSARNDRIEVDVTPAGWATIALGVVSYLVAWRAGWTEFAVVAAAALLAWVLVALTVPRRSSLITTRSLEPDRVTVGDTSIGSLEVRNTGRRRSHRVLAVDTVAGEPVELPVDSLPAGSSQEVPYTIPTRRRGVLPVGPLTIDRTDPLGLVRARRSVGQRSVLWVQPRVHDLRAPLAGWARDLDGATADLSPQGSAAFHTLREYQPGDDLRRVHWRSTARTNRLMVRHDVDVRRAQQLVILDDDPQRYPIALDGDDPFEVAVEVATSVAAAGLRAEHPTGVVIGTSAAPPLTQLGDVLDRMTEIQLVGDRGIGDSDRTFESLLAAARRHGAAVGTVVVVTGDLGNGEISDAVTRRRIGERLVVVRCRHREGTSAGSCTASALDRTTVLLDVSDAAVLAPTWASVVVGGIAGAGRR